MVAIKGFTDKRRKRMPRVKGAVYGMPRSGKTSLTLTGPEPIGVVPLDDNTYDVVDKVRVETGKRILLPEEDFLAYSKADLEKLDECQAATTPQQIKLAEEWQKQFHRARVNKIKSLVRSLAGEPDIATTVIDGGDRLWNEMLLAYFGRTQVMPMERTRPMQEYAELLDSLRGKHILVAFKSAEIWENNTSTGRYKPAAPSAAEYFLNVYLETFRVEDRKTAGVMEIAQGMKKGSLKVPSFGMRVSRSTINPTLCAEDTITWNEEVSFQKLGTLLYPDTELEDWE